MRVRVDRDADAVHLDLADVAVARREGVAPGVSVAYDAAGRIVGVALLEASRHATLGAALSELRVDLAGGPGPALAPTAQAAPAPAPIPAEPAPPAWTGPLTWDPEAEAAMARVPFFQRGPRRLATVALARERGLSVITAQVVAEARPRGR